MMLLWLVLITMCSGYDEIPLDRAEQSSTLTTKIAANAIDGNLNTISRTTYEDPAWLRIYFTSSSTVERVVVERSWSAGAPCVYTVSVYDGGAETVCGTFVVKKE